MPARFWPLERGHEITSPFGARWGTTHWGTDFGWPGGSAGRPVFAVQGGTVTQAGPASGFGQWVNVDHPAQDGGGLTVYGHVIPEVRVGQRVEAGQRIARINPDSNTNGGVAPHLHLEWHRSVWVPPGPDRLDPLPLLQGAQYPGEATAPGPTTPGGTMTDPVFGIDVSNHQGDFNFAGAAAEGYRFATHKVVEGDGYADPFWPRARDEMRRHFPGRFGGYVFCRTNVDPQREADFMLGKLGDPSIPVQIDYEDTTNGGSGRDLAARVQAYRDRGVRLLPVYLPRWFWRDHMGSPDLAFLRDVGLWNSNYVSGTGYGSALYDPNSAGWQGFGGADVRILQFTEQAQVAGQRIDANAVKDPAALDRIFGTNTGGTPMPNPPLDTQTAAGLTLDQLAGPNARNGAGFPGWECLGNRTVVEALGAIGEKLGVPGCKDVKK
ncbi:peptidoglycan DD-metalloendopeptidase family protein [Tsukamurella asaccharolytica]|uniref:Peptidoglycan DD-metalloendopeptidase family protein n=1 Tax=Tsukamurella asaccharolytica TaxID=2592067 RepID=A0A5C5RCF3_9ACTN|nr:peptidoglycan DD-metalloendopeptidase family protein [Tsukamurella asaccharolytica]TWS20767.1 peptidoglycan DD-metalloendopeptidase family protein [Tsukamurella asaccharolytica]